ISQIEWRAHAAIRNITDTHQDPECIQVQAMPENVEAYLRVKDWLTGIQHELDISWAVLGEVHGLFRSVAALGLKWRRIRSNLDDIKNFAQSVPYLPHKVQIQVARAELLSLLIRPLYGDDPSYGIRELIQNSVD